MALATLLEKFSYDRTQSAESAGYQFNHTMVRVKKPSGLSRFLLQRPRLYSGLRADQ